MKFIVLYFSLLLIPFMSVPLESPSRDIKAASSKVVEVYILAGQSNAVGYNNIDSYAPSPFPAHLKNQNHILFWPGSNAKKEVRNTWTTLQVGLSKTGTQAFGPEITFAHKLSEVTNEVDIAILKYAVGGTGIARSHDYKDYIPGFENFDDKGNNWYPPIHKQESGKLYQNLLNNIHEALKSLEEKNINYRLAGFIWMQGEHEASISKSMAQDYQSLLNSFIFHLRNDLKLAQLPVVIGQISDKWIYRTEIQSAQENICQKDSTISLVLTNDLPRTPNDNAHYTANGMVILGERFADEMLKLKQPNINH